MERLYYLYQVRNKRNGKIYIGVHQTDNLNDGYMGSGELLKKAFQKHGLESFEKLILEYFESEEEMYAREREVVSKDFINRTDTYNIALGGFYGKTRRIRAASPESIAKMVQTSKERGRHQGANNSQFGTCCIFHPQSGEKKRVKKEHLESYLANGWCKREVNATVRFCQCSKQLHVRNTSGFCQTCWRKKPNKTIGKP